MEREDRPRLMRRAGGDAGQVMLFVAVAALALLVVLALLLATLGGMVNDRARARTAADGAALAGASSGRAAAEVVAAANDGVVESYEREGGRTTVQVRVGRARASASATSTWAPGSTVPTGFPVPTR